MDKVQTSITLKYSDVLRIYDSIKKIINDAPEKIPDLTVAEFAELYRVLPIGTPYPGKWRNKRTPYLVEIMETLSANCPIQEIVIMKSAQVGATSIIENWFGYIIKVLPGPTLYISGNEKLLEKWTAKRLQPLLMSTGLSGQIHAQFLEKGQRRTGDKMYSKEFAGGSLDLVTANSAIGLRMDSARNLGMDEVDTYPWDLNGEGDPKEIATARTKAWKDRKKILFTSTPTTYDESHIWPLYQSGDQRRFHVPCKHCGHMQFLEFEGQNGKGGMKWDIGASDRLIKESVRYECIACGDSMYENDKYDILQKGVWKATAISSDENRRSYHISALYSLMENWHTIVKNHIKGQDSKEKMRSHQNLDLGLPFRETGERPSIQKVYELRGNYKSKTIPDGVLFLTGSLDVQLGSKHGKDNVSRLEIEICGHGYQYKTWSILYKVFKGDVMDAYSGAWEDLNDWATESGLKFIRSDGYEFSPVLFLMDSSEGKTENIVFDFCERWENTFPIKGAKMLKKTSKTLDGERDEESPRDADKYRENRKGGRKYFVISTNWYKKRLYNNLKKKRYTDGTTPPQFCDFPKDYPDKYFQMLVAEEWRPDDNTFWKPASRRNESLDLRVYNLCAHDIWLDIQLKRRREAMVKSGNWSKADSEYLRIRHIIDQYVKETARLDVA